MKKILWTTLLILTLPHAASAATYTCSVDGLGTLDVADPFGRDASTVSTFNSRCTNAGGTVSGPAQQFERPVNTAPMNYSTPTPGPASTDNGGFCQGGQCTYIPLEQLPGMDRVEGIRDPAHFGAYLTAAFRIFIILGGMFAVATFVFGGVTYMTTLESGRKDWARKQMQRAVYGILLLLGSYLLLYTINPELTIFRFNPGAITGTRNPALPAANALDPSIPSRAFRETNGEIVRTNATDTGGRNLFNQQCQTTYQGHSYTSADGYTYCLK